MAGDILDELVGKAPAVASSSDRLGAATDYIGRVRAAVAQVRVAMEAAKVAIAASDMQMLRERYAARSKAERGRDDGSVVWDSSTAFPRVPVFPTTVQQQRPQQQQQQQQRQHKSNQKGEGALERLERERLEDIDIVMRTATKAEMPNKAAVAHLGDAVDGVALFEASERALDAALLGVEARFASQVIDAVTGDLRKAKTDVLLSMLGTVGAMM